MRRTRFARHKSRSSEFVLLRSAPHLLVVIADLRSASKLADGQHAAIRRKRHAGTCAYGHHATSCRGLWMAPWIREAVDP